MARVLVGQVLAEEDMSQMSIAAGAADLGPLAVWIDEAFHCAREISIKGRPAATSIKFRLRIVQWGIASPAEIGAWSVKRIELARKRHLRPLFDDDTFLVSGESIPGHI